MSEDQKEFIRDQVKQVLLKEVAASKVWGKIPSVQATFQLEIGNLISLLLTFHNYSVHVNRRKRRRSRRKTNKTCFWWYLLSAFV